MNLASIGNQLIGVGMVGLGVVILAFSIRYVWRAHAVRRSMSVSTVTGMTRGALVRVSGSVEQGTSEALTAPFSGQDCFALRYSVEERRLSPALLPWFVTIHETAGSVPFRVRTPTGTVDIEAPARTVTLDRHVVATVPPNEDPPQRIARFEQNTTTIQTTVWRAPPTILQPLMTALSLGTRRYTEEQVTLGEDITVVGRVTDTGDGVDPLVVSDRSPLRTLFQMAKTSLLGVLISLVVIAIGLAIVLL